MLQVRGQVLPRFSVPLPVVPVLQPAAVQGLQVPEPGLSEPELRLSWLLPNKLLRLIPLNTVFRLRSLQRCHRLWN